MLLALIGNTLHDNPYYPSTRGSLFSGDQWRLGYYGLGVFLLGFVKWIIEQASRDKIDRLYFLSRDGLIMKKAYDLLFEHYPGAPESHYLLCSRRAVNLAKIKNESGIIDLLNVDFVKTSVKNLFDVRFGLKEFDIDIGILNKYGLEIDTRVDATHLLVLKESLLAHKEKIFSVAERERNNYLQYLDDEGFLNHGSIAIVDIGYAGTMQESLFELSDRHKPIHGYYLMTFRQALQRVEKKGLFAKAYLANFVDRHDTFHPFCKFVPLYETLFSNSDASFIKMEKDWRGVMHPVYMDKSPQEEKREHFVEIVHDGALQFIENCSTVFGGWLRNIDVEQNKSMRVLDQYFSNPFPADAKIMSGVVFEDSYGGAGFKMILPEDPKSSINCVWKAGKVALNKNEVRKIKKENFLSSPIKKFLNLSFLIFLKGRKKDKYIRDPKLFCEDSRYYLIRFIGRSIYA
jgi:hypothetical protein